MGGGPLGAPAPAGSDNGLYVNQARHESLSLLITLHYVNQAGLSRTGSTLMLKNGCG